MNIGPVEVGLKIPERNRQKLVSTDRNWWLLSSHLPPLGKEDHSFYVRRSPESKDSCDLGEGRYFFT